VQLTVDFKSTGKQIVRGISWLLLTLGGLVFFFGGRALHEFWGVDRMTAEAEGIVAAILLMFGGAGLKLAIGDQPGKQAK
jgi:hypothetical protein